MRQVQVRLHGRIFKPSALLLSPFRHAYVLRIYTYKYIYFLSAYMLSLKRIFSLVMRIFIIQLAVVIIRFWDSDLSRFSCVRFHRVKICDCDGQNRCPQIELFYGILVAFLWKLRSFHRTNDGMLDANYMDMHHKIQSDKNTLIITILLANFLKCWILSVMIQIQVNTNKSLVVCVFFSFFKLFQVSNRCLAKHRLAGKKYCCYYAVDILYQFRIKINLKTI